MEGSSGSSNNGFKAYWRRNHYERLDGSGRRRKNRVEHATLGSRRRRRFWRIKITPKLRFFHIGSPKKFFIRLRDAYVKMMLGFANSGACNPGFGGGAVGGVFGRPPLKEYDEKVIVEIYKSMMRQGKLVSRDAGESQGGDRLSTIGSIAARDGCEASLSILQFDYISLLDFRGGKCKAEKVGALLSTLAASASSAFATHSERERERIGSRENCTHIGAQ
ncbi:hypothetical protein HHK36_022977 [Tetracentron sinense]|uniref:Uncharacterized protein n=1 Tax=Tetracentron sinense TaxID=13715 RepID=A0A835DA48_TETSI|nr:hypothetical protein HHK36_022977 [Tetracentron sinense]